MKVLIVNNMQPFVRGGAEELAFHLEKNLINAGHQAEILRIPFQWEPPTNIPSQMLMVRALELYNVDRVIALKFPAYLIRHPRKTLWLLHQFRQAYDMFDAQQSNFDSSELHNEIRSLIKNADNESFAECQRIYTNSDVTRKRLNKYNGIDGTVLLPPVNDPEIFKGGATGDYIFAGGRVNSMKRQHLLLEALAKADKRVKLIIAGPPDSEEDGLKLQEAVSRLELADRVSLDLQFLTREAYAEYVNGAAAVAYLPVDEDSLGYVTMEAALAGKALVSTADSGGVLGLAKDQETGWVVEPNPDSIAGAMNSVFSDKSRARTYGQAARTIWASFNIDWQTTLESLLN